MDGRGGCCIARYAKGGFCDMSKVDRIMLRFRPIAPKPAAGGSVSGGSPPAENTDKVSSKTERGKRRCYREGKTSNKRSNSSKKRKASTEDTEVTHKTNSGSSVSGVGEAVVTLSLLPETPERKESPAARGSSSDHSDLSGTKEEKSPIWLSFSNTEYCAPSDGGHVLDHKALMFPQMMTSPSVTSIVTVECVTDTWLDANVLGFTDEEKMVKLARDGCPGFVSDGLNQVGWSNRAYRELVGEEGSGGVVVWLVMKERVPNTCAAFSCRVRVQYTCRNEKRSMTVPCDVWEMDGGGFAWRLDVDAALSLGRQW